MQTATCWFRLTLPCGCSESRSFITAERNSPDLFSTASSASYAPPLYLGFYTRGNRWLMSARSPDASTLSLTPWSSLTGVLGWPAPWGTSKPASCWNAATPPAKATNVCIFISTTVGGVPRRCVVPPRICTAPAGGTRTSTALPGARRANSCNPQRTAVFQVADGQSAPAKQERIAAIPSLKLICLEAKTVCLS